MLCARRAQFPSFLKILVCSVRQARPRGRRSYLSRAGRARSALGSSWCPDCYPGALISLAGLGRGRRLHALLSSLICSLPSLQPQAMSACLCRGSVRGARGPGCGWSCCLLRYPRVKAKAALGSKAGWLCCWLLLLFLVLGRFWRFWSYCWEVAV